MSDRSEVKYHIIPLPIVVETQQEGDKWVVRLPPWTLPELTFMGPTDFACEIRLERALREYWENRTEK